ncbi:glycosyltransferase [Psychrobacter sp. NG27]|uniref:glycosyltransferase n=1 Tax=Psychrobacter sp. NG27 TaxID=2781966 RepID=UPI0018DF9ABE|nr:glycosyltransferase family 2 protein [Psychrobacter sp. NG27]MBI0425632.1 glycosyltransferase family 2 protein [Psychrobacter sp. NG27]
MSSEIKLTICCLTYNHELYIDKAITSFLKQKTDFDFEIIIFDDCSLDSTTEIVLNFQASNKDRIKVIYPEENTFSKGKTVFFDLILEAKGEYIAFCEGDDYWVSDKKIQDQVNYLEKNKEINLCFHPSYTLINDQLKDMKYGFYGENTKVLDAKDVIKSSSGFMPMASIIARKNCFIDFFATHPDFFSENLWHSTIQILGSYEGGAGYLPYYYSVYRSMHSGSWSKANKDSVSLRIKNFESFLNRNKILRNMLPQKLSPSFYYVFTRKTLRFILKEKISISEKYKVLREFL